MTQIARDVVVSALRADDVARHFQIPGQWRGRWLRSRRCGQQDHGTEAFGLSRDGRFHCWACDTGGDLLKLIALGEGLDVRADFPRVLEIAAAIAGVDGNDDWEGPIRPPPKERPPLPEVEPIETRVARARKRASWVWDRMVRKTEGSRSSADIYLPTRSLDVAAIRLREEIRETHLRVSPQEAMKNPELKSLSYSFAVPGVALAVRAVTDGCPVDVRVRRYEPREDQPKIVGMLGGVTASPAEKGRPRDLIGCYGFPHAIDSDLVVVSEGMMDYLSSLQIFPNAASLGAVEAGSLGLVAAHAARALARRDDKSRLLIVEQLDEPRTLRSGEIVSGAADKAINEDPNGAAKAAIRILGPRRVGWLFCAGDDQHESKDLNDMLGFMWPEAIRERVRWWR